MPPHVKMSIKHDMGELFLNYINSIKQGNAYKLSHHSLLLHD